MYQQIAFKLNKNFELQMTQASVQKLRNIVKNITAMKKLMESAANSVWNSNENDFSLKIKSYKQIEDRFFFDFEEETEDQFFYKNEEKDDDEIKIESLVFMLEKRESEKNKEEAKRIMMNLQKEELRRKEKINSFLSQLDIENIDINLYL